jgi:hypothetical protein
VPEGCESQPLALNPFPIPKTSPAGSPIDLRGILEGEAISVEEILDNAAYISWVTPELWADKPALEAWMTNCQNGWAKELGYEPDGPVLGIHALRKVDHGEGLIMIEAMIFRRLRRRPELGQVGWCRSKHRESTFRQSNYHERTDYCVGWTPK